MITIIKNGKFTGTQYTKEQFTEDVQEFHKNDLWIDRPVFDVQPVEVVDNIDEDVAIEYYDIDYGEPTQEELATAKNNKVYSQIEEKENRLVRPIRELLSTTATDEARAFAQSKVDEIEAEIQTLRKQLVVIGEE